MPKSKGTLHLFLQGKGGVGKSTSAALFAQFRLATGRKLRCRDADPVNNSLSEFPALNVESISLLKDNEIDPGAFDSLMEAVLESSDDMLVDTGSSVFVPLSAYLVENQAIEHLLSVGKSVVVHMVIVGGQSMDQTMTAFDSVAQQFPEAAGIVLWLNEYHGPIEFNGLDFEQLEGYQRNKHRVTGMVRIPRKTERTFLADFREMLKQGLTFDEAISSDKFFVMSKQRLKIYREIIFGQLQAIPV